MNGLYTGPNETTFKTDNQIKQELYLQGAHPEPELLTNLPPKKDFHDWSAYFRNMQENRETRYLNHAEIQFFEPPLISLIGDTHIGGQETDYSRLEQEIELIVNTPNSFVILKGDLIDNFSFNPAQHETLEAVPQQVRYAKEMIRYLTGSNKLLAVWQGNHDYWSMRQGVELYDYLLDGERVPLFYGVGYLTLNVGDEQYKYTGAHKFKGSSMYNALHSQNRAIRYDGAFGSDIVASGHWHNKGVATQYFDSFGDETHRTTMIAIGTYKFRDGYTRDNSFPARDPKSSYGCAFTLAKDRHRTETYDDIIEAHRTFIQDFYK